MAYTDDYVELIEEVRDAITRLLDASTHSSWTDLRIVLGTLERTLERDRLDREREHHVSESAAAAARSAQYEEWRKGAAAWRQMPHVERQHRLLNVLGDERLGVRDITSRIQEANPELHIYESNVQALLYKMLEAGEVQRTQVPRGSRMLWLYFRPAVPAQLQAIDEEAA